MKHHDKTSPSDNSARLDALLSDFLSKDIVGPAQPESSSHPTSAPLGDLFSDAFGIEPRSVAASEPAPAVTPQKVVPVNRTEVWEATSGASDSRSRMDNLAAEPLEKHVNSLIETSAATRGKKLLFGSVAVIMLLAAGVLIWQSREARVTQQIPEEEPAAVTASEISPPEPPSTTPEVTATAGSSTHPAPLTGGAVSSSTVTREGPHSIAVSIPPSSGTQSSTAIVRGVSRSLASNATKLQQMPAPALGNSNLPLGTIQNLQSLQPAPPTTAVPLPPAPPDSTIKAVVPDSPRTTNATPAVPITKVQPTYPELARRMKLSGTVQVAIVVDTTGKVVSAQAVDGPTVLRGSAELAVRQWRFKPSTMNGKPVTGTGTVSIVFTPERR